MVPASWQALDLYNTPFCLLSGLVFTHCSTAHSNSPLWYLDKVVEGAGLAATRIMRARLALCGLCLALLHGSTHAATNVTRGNVQTYSFGYFGAHNLTGCES